MATMNMDIHLKQILLHKLKVRHTIAIPRHIMEYADIASYTDMAEDELRFQLTTYLTSAKWSTYEGTKSTVQYPTTWVDAFKLRWLPPALLARWPVKYTSIAQAPSVTNNYWIFPEIPPNPSPEITEFLIAYAVRKN